MITLRRDAPTDDDAGKIFAPLHWTRWSSQMVTHNHGSSESDYGCGVSLSRSSARSAGFASCVGAGHVTWPISPMLFRGASAFAVRGSRIDDATWRLRATCYKAEEWLTQVHACLGHPRNFLFRSLAELTEDFRHWSCPSEPLTYWRSSRDAPWDQMSLPIVKFIAISPASTRLVFLSCFFQHSEKTI